MWDNDAIDKLQTCFLITDWVVFFEATDDTNEIADTINDYILFCQSLHIQSKEVRIYPNNKPWITSKLKDLFKAKTDAFVSQDQERLKTLKSDVSREILNAKQKYKEKLESNFHANKPKEAWQCMQTMTDYKRRRDEPFGSVDDPKKVAEELNSFYCRFDTHDFADVTEALKTELRQCEDEPVIVDENEVFLQLKGVNSRKASGPDGISGKILRNCARELTRPFHYLFQRSLDKKENPLCWKTSTIIPVAKKPRPSELNDYRPVALTSVVMKCFERIVLKKLLQPIKELIDPYQFAYQQTKSVQDAVLVLAHLLFKHTDEAKSYVRALFVDFSSAFNTMQTHILVRKLRSMEVKPSMILWVIDFLQNRVQRVRVRDTLSEPKVTNTGSPQGCVLSPILFVLYTNDCRSAEENISLLKYADDTAVIGHIKGRDETEYREYVSWFKNWCKENFLDLNSSKTKEMIIDFRSTKHVDPKRCPIIVEGEAIEVVDTYKYLGTTISDSLKWERHCKSLYNKGQQRMYFLRKLRSFHVDRTILRLFYKAVIESVLVHDCVVWFSSCKNIDLSPLKRIVRQAEKIIGLGLDFENVCTNRVLDKARSILGNVSHPLNNNYVMLRSGVRLRSMRCRTSRLLNSFIPSSIRMLNERGPL